MSNIGKQPIPIPEGVEVQRENADVIVKGKLGELTKTFNSDIQIEIYEKDIFKEKHLVSGTIVTRAFKPLPIILELVEKNFKKYSNLIVLMGKNGKQVLDDSIKKWEFEYKEKRSLTSENSFLVNIKKIKKK